MKEQYQKEISQIHVPAELLERTKQAMKEEQEKKSFNKKGKIISINKVSIAAAAAVLLLVVLPVASGTWNNDTQENEQMQMHLADQNETELQVIKQEKNWIEELVDTLKDFFD